MSAEELNIHRNLIIRSQNGDSLAQEQLYKLYARAMYNICRRFMGDEEEARDILQEAFIDAFQKLSTLREINTFSLWIKRIVTNKCINALRKRKIFTEELKESFDVAGEDEEGELDYARFRSEQILKAIDDLPNGCRTVLGLYLFEGYDHKEIGQILKISESASKAQYSKARARIRNSILNEEKKQYAR